MRKLLKAIIHIITWIIILSLGFVSGVGVAGGIMYLNEKLNQYGTILIGG